jgi:hypothetical protein
VARIAGVTGESKKLVCSTGAYSMVFVTHDLGEFSDQVKRWQQVPLPGVISSLSAVRNDSFWANMWNRLIRHYARIGWPSGWYKPQTHSHQIRRKRIGKDQGGSPSMGSKQWFFKGAIVQASKLNIGRPMGTFRPNRYKFYPERSLFYLNRS